MEGLGINLGYVIVQIFNFAILMVIIIAWVIKPVRGMLIKRRDAIDKGLADAKIASESREQAEAKAKEIKANAEQEAARIIREANQRVEKIDLDAKDVAAKEIAAQRAVLMADIEEERNRMLQQLRGQVASLAIAATQKLIGESLDQTRQQKLVDEFFSGIKEGKVVVLSEAALKGASVVVTSALPLNEHEQSGIRADIYHKMQIPSTESIPVEFKVDPAILGGLIVRVGDQVIDGSVSGQLEELREHLS